MVAAQVLGTCARKGVGVRVPPSAPASPGFSEIELEIRSTVLLCLRFDTNSDTNSGRQHATERSHHGPWPGRLLGPKP